MSFRVLGFPVRVNPFFFVLAVFIGMPSQDDPHWMEKLGLWVAIVFAGVLAHELGHALLARAFGRDPSIELTTFGGLTWWPVGDPLGPVRSILVSGAGPAVGIVVGLPCLLVWMTLDPGSGGHTGGFPPVYFKADFSLGEHVLWSLIFVNLGWGLLNLIPMLPLDGGNVMTSVVELFTGDRVRARRFGRMISLGMAALIVALSIGAGLIFMALLGGLLAWSNFQGLMAERSLGDDRDAARMAESVEDLRAVRQDVQQAIDRGDGPRVLVGAETLMRTAPSRSVRAEAQVWLAWGRLLVGDVAGARIAFDAVTAPALVDPVLEGAFYLAAGDDRNAVAHFRVGLSAGGSAADRIGAALRALGGEALGAQLRLDEMFSK